MATTIGKNILDLLTTGMYYDSKVIYREYIQNACDQIDKAVHDGILPNKKAGSIDIDISLKQRRITIKDNATGIPTADFRRQLEDIANSDKSIGVNKGFRGIGRLCGLAYCKTLTFRSTYLGETNRSIMIMDAQKMREMLASPEKYTIDEILSKITDFVDNQSAPAEEHSFEVCLEDINVENTDLLDKDLVRSYLSFVAPVPYNNKFYLRDKIYEHARELGYNIDEYNVFVGGQQILKEYGVRLYNKSNSGGKKQAYDELRDLAFYDIRRGDELIAWMWYGLCRFEKAIPKAENPMYGFRVRQSNIQIGDNTILASRFKEERGNSYFVGEVFAVSPLLIPNSHRDNFNENETRVFFENQLQCYFYDKLHKLYYMAARLKNNYAKISDYVSVVNEYKEKQDKGFVDEKEKEALTRKLEDAKQQKDEAKKAIEKIPTGDAESSDPSAIVQKAIKEYFDKKDTVEKLAEAEKKSSTLVSDQPDKPKFFTDSLSKLDKRSRKLIAQVMVIVSKHTDEETLKAIRIAVEKEFR